MKLVYFFLYVNTFYACGEKVHQGQFSFPPNYPLANSVVSTDRSIYFPSEFQTISPYFTSNNYDDPYKLLPSIQAKLSNVFPTSFPIILTPTTDYKDELQRRLESNEKFNKSVPTPFMYNQTKADSILKEAERRTFPTNTHVLNYKQIDRMDSKASTQMTPSAEATKSLSTNSASKKFIISSENVNNEDLEQKASFHNIHFAPPPNVYIQSTTEIAIPILRLSNEMDLDGSFSYEALGADQTHYVQQSRMENLGTDKESQVVEGSYSYVGDNGQTYTVHYIADSNGYRATGDHLPVPPPVPEIIQRSIQYNLAEEAKKPPHLRYYYDNESDGIYNNDKNNQNYIPVQNNLFTGRTPEAFSFGSSQRSSLQNDLAPTTNSKELINQNIEHTEDKFKRNTNFETLEPQVTFLASQGASLPLNKPQKSTLPQLVNDESRQANPSSKESEHSKAMWRWQYGSNRNTENLNPTKNLISRSSSEGDDVIINFNEMSPMEYSKAIRNYENSYTNSNYDLTQEQQPKSDENQNYDYSNNDKFINANNSFENDYYYGTNNQEAKIGTEPTFSRLIDRYSKLDNNFSSTQTTSTKTEETFKANNPYTFAVSTHTPQWLDYESVSYKPKILTSYNIDNTNKYPTYDTGSSYSYSQPFSKDNYKVNYNEQRISSSTISPSNYNMIQDQEKKEFQEVRILPKRHEIITQNDKEQVTTTEGNINEMLRNNLFLRNLFKTRNPDTHQHYLQNEIHTESKMNSINTTPKSVDSDTQYVIITSPKTIRNEPTPPNEIKFIEKKPLDMTNVLYYVINKNVFESNKLKSKRKPLQVNNDKYSSRDLDNDSKNKEINVDPPVNQNNYRLQPQQQEIRGILKNYKVIQRNNVRKSNTEQENSQNAHELKNQNINSIKLPHLGRAGPSTKSYLPSVYL